MPVSYTVQSFCWINACLLLVSLLLCLCFSHITFWLWQKGGVIKKWSNFDSYSQLPWKYCLHSNQYKLLFLVELFSCFSGILISTEVSSDISIGIWLWRARRCNVNIGFRLRREIISLVSRLWRYQNMICCNQGEFTQKVQSQDIRSWSSHRLSGSMQRKDKYSLFLLTPYGLW